jgi:pilus assembly protein CpaE
MGDSLSLVTICLDTEFARQLRSFIDSTPLAQLVSELQHYLADEGDTIFIDRLKDLGPDICMIDFDRDREKAGRTAEKIHEALPNTAIFACSSNAQPDLIIRAMRSGCGEYLIKPVDRDQLLEAMARVGSRKKEKKEQVAGQVLAFLGAKGGTGVTTLAIHLAAVLAQRFSQRTLLVDLHPDLGDAALFLGLARHQYHFYDLAENTHRLDAELLQGFLVQHASGLDVVPAPDGLDMPRRVAPDAVERTLEFLRLQYKFVVVDCQNGLSEQNLTVIDHADQLYLVATPEVPAVRDVARHLEFLGRFDYSRDKVRVVINRHSKSSPISDVDIEKAIRRGIYWMVPNQYGDVIKSINTGNPLSLVAKSEFMRSLVDWAQALVGKPSELPKKESKGLFGFRSR